MSMLISTLSAPTFAASQSRLAFYAVAGKTPQEIYEIIKTSAPRVASNATFALTTPATKTISKTLQVKGVCKYTKFKTSTFYIYTLPRHIKPETMSAKTRAKWNGFVEYLKVHEQGHGKSWDSCLSDYDQEALGLAAKNCQNLEKSREKLFTKIKRLCLERDEKMDFVFRKEVQSVPFLREALRK